jgi:hypothetical protein
MICLVGFDGLAFSAKRARGGNIVFHGLADAVRKEPRGLVGDAKHAVQLKRADALLGGGKQVSRIEPLVQGNVRSLEHGADRHRERLAALVALIGRPDACWRSWPSAL